MDPRRARIRRPADLVVTALDGTVLHRYRASRPMDGTWTATGDRPWRRVSGVWPQDITPVFDDDGLVSDFPDVPVSVDVDQPFFRNYHWVAMLDPSEFADTARFAWEPGDPHGVDVGDVRMVTHHGRPAWEAIVQSTPAYEPRCMCCALLTGDLDMDTQQWVPGVPATVRLDRGTGICVFVEHQGHERGVELDVEIVAAG